MVGASHSPAVFPKLGKLEAAAKNGPYTHVPVLLEKPAWLFDHMLAIG